MDVGKALRNTSKGRLKYDKYWVEEGRTQEILDNVSKYSSKVAINVSPKVLSSVISSLNQEESSEEKNSLPHPDVSSIKSVEKSNDKCNESDTLFYELQTETELPILEYEEERLKYIQDIFKSKKEEFEIYSKCLEKEIEQKYHLLKRNFELDGKRRAADLKKIEDAVIEEAKEKELLLKQHHQTQAKKLSAIVQEAEMKQKKAEEESRRKQQEQEEFSLQLTNCKAEVENSILRAGEKLRSCEYPSYLKIPVNNRIKQMTEFVNSIKVISDKGQFQPLSIEDVFNANDVLKKAYETLQDITNDLEHAKVKALQDHEKKQKELEEVSIQNRLNDSKSESVAWSQTSAVKTDNQIKSVNGKDDNDKSKLKDGVKEIISGFIAPDVVQEYHKINENLKAIQSSVQPFIDDPRNKKYRFELQKSINVPINAISSVSGAHVRDKISRLLSILSEKAPNKEMINESVVYNFCANLVAKKFVEQGDKQISAQHSTAFPIALAVVGVWIKKPDVGLLIRGHLYLNCPYLVPYYPPRKENQSNQEYYTSLGYCFDKEGNMEEKYKFLNRMSGFMRLYAAIILSPVPPASTKYPHPHGIAYGWRWLSRLLNMEPRPDITATLLYDFLDVTGHALQKTYGRQFKKLLHIICKDFFKKIKEVTPSGSGGPVERLETFLQQSVTKGYIPPPEGILYADFWNR